MTYAATCILQYAYQRDAPESTVEKADSGHDCAFQDRICKVLADADTPAKGEHEPFVALAELQRRKAEAREDLS